MCPHEIVQDYGTVECRDQRAGLKLYEGASEEFDLVESFRGQAEGVTGERKSSDLGKKSGCQKQSALQEKSPNFEEERGIRSKEHS